MVAQIPSLEELLRLSLPGAVTWLATKPDSETNVDWVVSDIADAKPGDLLLIPAGQFSLSLLNECREHGVSVILCLGKPSDLQSGIPDQFSLGYITLGQEGRREIKKAMLTMLVNQRVALVERGARIHAQLSQMEAEGEGLLGLVKAMADLSMRGVLLQDKRGQILAHCPASSLVEIWQDILQQLDNLNSLPGELLDRKRAGSKPTVLSQDIPGGLVRLVMPITVGEVARGYLSLIGIKAEFDTLDYLVIEQGGLVCAIEMARNKAIRETEKRLKGDLLSAILQENLSPRDASLWVQSMGLDLNHAHVALRFAWEGQSPPSRRRLETIINGEITRQNVKAIVNPMGSEVICFCQVSRDINRPESALDLGRKILELASVEYPEIKVRCGVGMPAVELEDWRASFTQAGQALEMARRLKEDQPFYFSDLSVYRLLFQIEHSPELIAFQEEILGTLLATEGASELIHTLEAFFAHNGNLSQTAEALYIHRNTLTYRMERIHAITHLDIDKPENRLAAQLALYIYRMTSPALKPK
jgi:purine catabolism regulator